ncbi:MAG: hypothetical protein H6864_07025 [Micavibrio sp.]|nr:hypothetical protein [Micavibrio sp.]
MMGFSISRIISRAWGHVALSVLIGIGLVSLIAPSCAFAATSVPFTINMSEAVTVTGTPRIAVDVGGVTRYATYTSGSGSAALVFTYAMVAGDVDLDGVSLSSPIDLNGGTITDLNGNPQTDLTFTVPNTSGVKIDYPSLSMDFIYDADGRYTLNGTAYNDLTSFLGASGGTFSRASIGTYFDSSGTLQTASSGTPRFDHDPITHAPKGILIEEARTNLLQYSGNIGMGNWAIDGGCSTLVADATTAPDGSNNASRIIYSCGGARKTQSITVSTITPLTFSIFLKPSSSNNGSRLLVYNNTTTTSLGSINIPSLLSGGTAYANGWRRYSLTVSSGWISGNSLRFYVYTDSSGGAIVGNDLYVWGAQVEAGSFPTSYIPTTTAAVTRAADNLTVPTASWYNASSGSLYAEADTMPYNGSLSGAISIAFFNDVTTNNEWGLRFDAGGTNTASPYVAGGVNQTTIYTLPVLSGINKTVHAMSSNTRSTVGNGGTVRTGTYSSPPAITTLDIGKKYPSSYLNGWIQRAKYYPARVSDTQLQLMTQ